MTTEQSHPFSGRRWLIDVATIGQGKSGTVEASPAECTAVAADLDLLACQNLALTFDVKPMSGRRLRLKAAITCDVVQASVVSLEPVASRIDEHAESELVAEGTAPLDAGEGAVDILNAPVVETYAEGRVDLGLIAFELLSVSLEPYPRLPGEALADEGDGAKGSLSPFAALAALRKKDT